MITMASGTSVTPRRGVTSLSAWDNGVLARAVAKWTDEVKCTLNGCKNPSAPGSWSASCDGSGTVGWNVGLNGFRAASTFTYKGCHIPSQSMSTTPPAIPTPLTQEPPYRWTSPSS